MRNLFTIAITGTKGKTSLADILYQYSLQHFKGHTLFVNNTGTMLNKEQTSNKNDSIKIFGMSPHVFPGRYIKWIFSHYKVNSLTAVLEASHSSYEYGGIGVKEGIDIGIFTNIYDDHIDINGEIKSKKEMFERKSFIFKQIKRGGVLVANFDNIWTRKAFDEVDKEVLAIGISSKKKTLSQRNSDINTYKPDDIIYEEDGEVFSVKKGFCFNLRKSQYFSDSVHDLVAGNFLYAYAALAYSLKLQKEFENFLESYTISSFLGRYQIFTKKDRMLVLDFAHEPISICNVINRMSRSYQEDIVLVNRIDASRSKSEIVKTAGKLISDLPKDTRLKKILVYDKVDYKHEKHSKRKIGETANIYSSALSQALESGNRNNITVETIINEQDALNRAIEANNMNIIHIYTFLEDTLEIIKSKNFSSTTWNQT